MSRAYESVHRLQNNLNHKNQNLTSQQNRTNIYTKNDRFSRNEEIHCENSDETNLFYSFQMQVEECDRDNSNSGKYQQQMYTPASSKTLQLPVLQLPCEKCDKTFPSKQSLSAHIRIFHGPSLNKTPDGHVQHECEYCHKLFSQATGLAEHRRIHTGEKPYQCKVCLKSFSRSIYLCVHSRSHTGERPYSCKICNKSFTQKKSLSSHARIHTGERPFSCTECHKPFARSSYLRIHMRSHTGERPYTCAVCDKSFSQKQSLSVHMKTHTNQKSGGKKKKGQKDDSFSGDDNCYTPNGVISQDLHLPRDRMMDVDSSLSSSPGQPLPSSPGSMTDPQNFTQDYLSRQQTLMEAHNQLIRYLDPTRATYPEPLVQNYTSTHPKAPAAPKNNPAPKTTPAPKTIPPTIPKLLVTPDILPRHHLDPSPRPHFPLPLLENGLPFVPLQPNGKPHEYLCKDCGEGFPNMRDLGLHERTHTGLYKYQCKLCSKAFRKSYNLRLHMRSHTGEKPYQCTTCGKWFTQSSSLLVHMKIHAKEKEEANQG